MDKVDQVRLVELARRGDSGAFARLYEDIYKDLYRTALYNLGNPEDAENVVSDTVLDAYAGIGKLKNPEAFRGWIFRILDFKIRRVIKSYVSRREHESENIDNMTESLPSALNDMEMVENRSVIQHAFSVLTEEERQIVTMTVYGEYDSGEIAGIMGINRNTVRSKYSRALIKMRKLLGGENYGR